VPPNLARRWQNCLKSDAFLSSAKPADWLVDPSWQALVEGFWQTPDGHQLSLFLNERQKAGAHIFPHQPLRALQLTPLPEVRVVILGQDPYHGLGQAEGLAFSVQPGVQTPPSLRNIFKEMRDDLGLQPPMSGSLQAWAQRGVLLLNTCLTVEEGQAGSHAKRGWEALTDALIQAVAARPQACVFMLWGAHAQTKAPLIAQASAAHAAPRLLLQANHPSPLSALRGPTPFMGCRHFSQARNWLESQNLPLDWSLEA
jgi:uracil-DNA glycosylase